MINIFGWMVWVVLLLITLSFSYGIIRSLLSKKSFTYAILVQAVIFGVVLFIFYFNPIWNKLHIIWLVPLTFFMSSFLINNYFIKKKL